jgi:uncharacterized circularly permuted ATP-grasp superfamily protein
MYGPCEILADGVVRPIGRGSSHYHRSVAGFDLVGGVRARCRDRPRARRAGAFKLEDNSRTPSGISYVIENRRAMTRVPGAVHESPDPRVADYPQRLVEALRRHGPTGDRRPRGGRAHAGREQLGVLRHSFLARQMGVELVEGATSC